MGGQIQVISGDGTYEGDAVEAFLQGHDVSKAGVDYTTVAIMGPQSSGKSTLLNAVFGTDFKMMDAEGGRSQTTQGVWLDLSPKVTGMPTFVLDLEGSDGRERGEDDTTFERQSALFALAMADILMINLFAVNVGRVQGSGAPLLKTVLQVNLKLFLTAPSKNKTVLLIVIRDRTKTPHEKICADMRRDLDTIWASLVKPPEYADSSLEEFFSLQYVTLPSYELEEDDFKAECTLLRRRFLPENEDSYIRQDEMKVPASALPLHLKEIWSVIHAQKDLDLPAHKVMVAHIRCRDIATEQLKAISNDGAWQSLLEDAVSGSEVPDFSARSSSLIESCLYGYDTEAMYFVDAVRTEQKEELQKQLFAALQPAFSAQQALLQNKLKQRFVAQLTAAVSNPSVRFSDVATSTADTLIAEYDGEVRSALLPVGSPWETGTEGFRGLLQTSVAQLRQQAIDACEAQVMEEVEAAVDGPAWMTISQMPADLWLQLRSIIKQALKQSVMSIDQALDGYGVAEADIQALNVRVATALSTKLVKAIRKFLKQLSSGLMTKFTTSFEEEGGVRRGWNSDLVEDATRAHKECALALSQFLLVPQGLSVPGASEAVFRSSQTHLMEFSNFKQTTAPSTAASPVNGERETPALLTMMKWSPDVSQEAVLLSPSDVRHVWQDFINSSQQVVRRAKELQDERKRARNRPLPMWVFPALIFFGWNEVVHLLKNPTWLILSVFLILFLYQLYHELEVDREMEKGLPAFAINCGRKLVPASKRIIANTGDAIKNLWTGTLTDDSQRAPTPDPPQTPPQPGEIEMTPLQDSPVQGLHQRKGAMPNPATAM